ncbi:MAG: adenosylcobinamide-GDP ribazoletransferase [Clostridia bacterium]
MNIICSLVICFAMYSIIPMPLIQWTEEKRKYCFCFLPVVGVIIGAVWFLLYGLLQNFSIAFSAIILMLISVVISGGIHFDGLLDTCDAMFSYGDKEKKLEILKDPRTGAFGVIGTAVYLALLFASYNELLALDTKLYVFVPFSFVLSRALASFCMLTVQPAKKTGLGASFSNASNTKVNQITLVLWMVLVFVIFAVLNYIMAVIIAIAITLFLAIYIRYIKRDFGGISGDLTGFIVMAVELIIPFCVAIGGHFL